jgi:hypothetical protein
VLPYFCRFIAEIITTSAIEAIENGDEEITVELIKNLHDDEGEFNWKLNPDELYNPKEVDE